MKFDYEGTSYLIEFERQSKVPDGSVGVTPRRYTTAFLLKVTHGTFKDMPFTTREVVRTYTVGCNHKEQFNYELGRKYALALALYDAPTKGGGAPLMGAPLTKEFRTAVWKAYHSRGAKVDLVVKGIDVLEGFDAII